MVKQRRKSASRNHALTHQAAWLRPRASQRHQRRFPGRVHAGREEGQPQRRGYAWHPPADKEGGEGREGDRDGGDGDSGDSENADGGTGSY